MHGHHSEVGKDRSASLQPYARGIGSGVAPLLVKLECVDDHDGYRNDMWAQKEPFEVMHALN